ncbi:MULTISPECIES: hypothetical protein [Rhizobium]|jgi:queuine/archaeosine tRNA-ribosyltransferase|uniref:hypothetical protein n=1 Tax=Rhizobium TaxID=379 RepID=UPI0010302A2E|nr:MULTISPECIES: hypothetical protein [Rhizobium]MDV4157501.1 hypothetical protein [Rhizobium brockwellii]TAX97293.1 hypothetical protein ELH94_12625 [Rhizobium leguminosarum]
MSLVIKGKTLSLPALIPSISSFETQIAPESAFDLQAALSEPITLVSAYDIHDNPNLIKKIAQFRIEGKIVLMDSGGYEASRINRYSNDEDRWKFENFKNCAASCETDLVASFDYFKQDSQSFSNYETDFISFIQEHDFIDKESLIPVIHLQDYIGTYTFSQAEALAICDRIVAEFSPAFIAIPERELGSGMAQKVRTVRAITEQLAATGRATKLHVLGCGNPLSFALLCAAGASMADGLEWCRTLVGADFKLHHFQQAELFDEPSSKIYNPTVEVIRNTVSDYKTLTLTRNLYALQQFNTEVVNMLAGGHLADFIEDNFGLKAAQLIRG